MKLIGILGRVYYNKDNQDIIQLNDALRKTLSSYQDISIIIIPPPSGLNYHNTKMGNDKLKKDDKLKLDYILNKCDGFIIPGGSSWYCFDEYVIKYAIKHKLPTLAICAGFQALASMFTTNRTSFDMTFSINNSNHYGPQNKYIHQNKILPNTLLYKILNEDNILVNSIHHSYIKLPVKELIISAISEDSIIEALELPNHPFLLGLQWHPEYLNDINSKKIFDYFIKKL